MVPKEKFVLAVVALATLTINPATAGESFKSRIYDSAKHTRIYFPSGVDAFADEVTEYTPGKKHTPHLWETGEPALGPPNFKDHEADRLARKPSFAGLGGGGSITLRFVDNAIVDGTGPDLYIFEPNENSSPVKVEVSRDGKNWLDLGEDLSTASEIDIAEKGGKNAVYNFVRITDKSNVDPADQWPGADIDAVGALNSAVKISNQDHDLCLTDASAKKTKSSDSAAKTDIAEAYKKVVETFEAEQPSKLIVEVYSDTHAPKDHNGGSESAGPSSETKNPQAKQHAEAVSEFLVSTGKIPKDKLVVEYFDDARSLARRDVAKEHERDNRFNFIFVPYDRDTVIGDKGQLKIQHAAKLIDGKWDSDDGEVIFMTAREPGSNKVLVQGEWHENPARKGVIQSGVYDPSTQMLNIAIYKTWSNVRGNAEFKMSFDSVRLKGKWTGEVKGGGDWLLMRK